MAKILVFEKDKFIVDLLKLAFARENHEYQFPEFSTNLIDNVLKEEPDILVVDLFIPGWNALDFIRDIRISDQANNIWIVVISSLAFKEVLSQAILAGANDFVIKPFDIDYLMKRIDKRSGWRDQSQSQMVDLNLD